MVEQLTPLDTQFLGRDSQVLVTGALILEQPTRGERLTHARVVERVTSALGHSSRPRQRVAPSPLGVGPPIWDDDPDFDARRHVRRVEIDHPLSVEEYQGVAADLLRDPFDLDHPPWRLDVVEELDGDRVGIVAAGHHVLGDAQGVFGFMVMLLLDLDPDAPLADITPWSPQPVSAREVVEDRVRDAVAGAREAVASARIPSLDALGRRVREVAGALRLGWRLQHDPGRRAPFNVQVASHPRVRFYSQDQSEVRRLGRALTRATINDVLLASTAAGLRSWLAPKGDEELFDYRAFVPVRRELSAVEEGIGSPTTDTTAIVVPLPVTSPRPLAQIHQVFEATATAKGRGDARHYDTLRDLVFRFSILPGVRRSMSNLLNAPELYNLILSNFPGPPVPLYVRGAELVEFYPMLSCADEDTVRITITSIRGRLSWGIVSDWGDGPDLDRFVAGLDAWYEELRESVHTLEVVQSVPAFAALDPADVERIVAACGRRMVRPGDVVVQQGDIGTEFFVIAAGTFEVTVDGVYTREMHLDDSFGEIALVRDEPRTATVRARTDGCVYVIPRDVYVPVVTGDARASRLTEAVIARRAGSA